LALALLEKGDHKSAAEEFRIVLIRKPDLLAAHNGLASALRETGQLDAAQSEFRAALKIDPLSVDALSGLTKILIEQKRYSAAIQCLQDAPADNGLQLNLAIAYSKNGDKDQAIAILSSLVKSQPDLALAHFNLASVYAQQNRFREAADEYGKALGLDPSNDVARVSLVKALTILSQYSEALPLIEDHARRHPKDFEGHKLLGIVYRGLGRDAEAEAELRRAVEMRPGDYESRYNLGFILARLGKPGEALPQLRRAQELNPDSSEVRFQLASVLRALKRYDSAREELKTLQQQKQASVKESLASVRANEANQYLQSGDIVRAVEIYREVLRENPANARTYYNLAMALERLNDRAGERQALEQAVGLDEQLAAAQNQLGVLDLEDDKIADAEKRFKIALMLDPQYAEVQSNLGVLYGRQGKAGAAEALFRQAIENNPRYAQAYVNLGLILANLKRFSEAEKEIQNALRIEPSSLRALSALGMVQTRLGRQGEAVESFRKVATLDPKSPDAHLNLGIALADQFNLEGALAEFSESVRLAPDSPDAHYNKGRSLFDLRRNDQAKFELEAAVRLAPDYAGALYLLGLIEKQAENPRGSAQLLKKLVALEPGNADALYVLGQDDMQLGNSAEAVADWKRVLQINPERGEALYNLSRLLARSDPADARRYQARFTELQQKRRITERADMLGNFAIASAAARDWVQAVSQLEEALAVCGECASRADLHKNLGLIYCHSGDLKDGMAELLVAQKLKPNDPDIETALRLLDDSQQQPALSH
jgi:tetratricopeptide (TPR) repeat protein